MQARLVLVRRITAAFVVIIDNVVVVVIVVVVAIVNLAIVTVVVIVVVVVVVVVAIALAGIDVVAVIIVVIAAVVVIHAAAADGRRRTICVSGSANVHEDATATMKEALKLKAAVAAAALRGRKRCREPLEVRADEGATRWIAAVTLGVGDVEAEV